MVVEICFLFGKTIILLLSDRVSVNLLGGGFDYFFSESQVISNSKITCLYFSGGANPIPRPKMCSNAPS